MIYQENTEKEGPIPTPSSLNQARKKIKQRMITRWSRLYKKVHARQQVERRSNFFLFYVNFVTGFVYIDKLAFFMLFL